MFQYFWIVAIGIVGIGFVVYTVWSLIYTFVRREVKDVIDFFEWYWCEYEAIVTIWVFLFVSVTVVSFIVWLCAER